jgi:hypothetical protein
MFETLVRHWAPIVEIVVVLIVFGIGVAVGWFARGRHSPQTATVASASARDNGVHRPR